MTNKFIACRSRPDNWSLCIRDSQFDNIIMGLHWNNTILLLLST